MNTLGLKDLKLYDIGSRIVLSGIILNDTKKNTYLLPLPNKQIKNVVVLDMNEDDWKTLIRQMDLQETEILAVDDGKLTKAIVRKSTRQVDSIISWNVYRRDGYTCRYCGKNNVPLSVDHLVLWEDGGPSIEENLLTSCHKCNRTRGNMQYEKWIYSDEYLKLSDKLSPVMKRANIAIIKTLESIPIKVHVISRGTNSKKKKKKKQKYSNTPNRHNGSNKSMKF